MHIFRTIDYLSQENIKHFQLMLDKDLEGCFEEVPIDRTAVEQIINDINPEPSAQTPVETLPKKLPAKQENVKKQTANKNPKRR